MLIKPVRPAFTTVRPAPAATLRSAPLVRLAFTFRMALASMLILLSVEDTARSAPIMVTSAVLPVLKVLCW